MQWSPRATVGTALVALVVMVALVLIGHRVRERAPTAAAVSSQDPAPELNSVASTTSVAPRLTIGTATVVLEIADTPEALHRGLSGRNSLAEDHGLLFVFPTPDRYGFWMPDMHFAIDIIWLDDKLRVVYIKNDATPDTYPEVFKPDTPARYVLEVPAGYAASHGIVVGTQASGR
jgi:uncharacterized membrane protein (UPF0127 family)